MLDAVIIGGGPAGSVAAWLLARRGLHVAVVERRAGTVAKPCGGCLSPAGCSVLDRLGLLETARAAALGSTDHVRFSMSHSTLRVPLRGTGLIVARHRFDAALLAVAEAAGAEVLRPASAQHAEIAGEGVRLRGHAAGRAFALRARMLIGADGVGSRAAAWLGLAARHRGRGVGFACTVEATPAAPSGIDMYIDDAGYIGIVRAGHGQVHIGGLLRGGATAPAGIIDRLAGQHAAVPVIDGSATIRGVGPLPWRPRAVACARGALIGDAGGYEEPITGEGITWALRSAELLDQAIEQGDGRWSEVAADRYQRAHRAALSRGHRWSRWIAAALRQPAAAGLLLGAARLTAVQRALARGAAA